MAKIIFFSPVPELGLFERVGFYATDIKLLTELGHEVILSNKISDVIFLRYDILFSYFYTWGSIATAIGRVRGAVTFLSGGADELDGAFNSSWRKLFFHRLLFGLGYVFSKKILVVSKTDFKNMSQLVGQRKLVLAPHVVDTDLFTPGSGPRGDTLLTIGWMGTEGNVRRKGIDVAIKLVAELRARRWQGKLIIAGTPGPGADALKRQAKESGVSSDVEFKFGISEEEKVFLMQTSSFYLQLSEFEGFGLAALEALSCGLCVVHTGRGGLADFLDGYGLLQEWPVNVKYAAAKMIEANSVGARVKDIECERHQYVASRYSLSTRRDLLRSLTDV